MKSDTLTEIECRLKDCIFYHSAAAGSKALCNHKDIPLYVHRDPPCPLYRLDWQKKMIASQQLYRSPPKRKF